MPTPLYNTCWACQGQVTDAQCVRLGVRDEVEIFIPCCQTCWAELPVGQKLTIAQRHWELVPHVKTWDAVRDLIEKVISHAAWRGIAGAADDDDPADFWRRGRGN